MVDNVRRSWPERTPVGEHPHLALGESSDPLGVP